MKITLELENKIVTIENNGIDIHDAIEIMKDALLAIGFHPDTVKANFEDDLFVASEGEKSVRSP